MLGQPCPRGGKTLPWRAQRLHDHWGDLHSGDVFPGLSAVPRPCAGDGCSDPAPSTPCRVLCRSMEGSESGCETGLRNPGVRPGGQLIYSWCAGAGPVLTSSQLLVCCSPSPGCVLSTILQTQPTEGSVRGGFLTASAFRRASKQLNSCSAGEAACKVVVLLTKLITGPFYKRGGWIWLNWGIWLA